MIRTCRRAPHATALRAFRAPTRLRVGPDRRNRRARAARRFGDARPIEAALRELLRKGGKVTTKDVTKHLRKKGLLSSEDDKKELKETMSSIARIRKEGNVAYVVLQ